MNPIFRSDSLRLRGVGITEVEKRQLFLRSYQFSRKQSGGQKMKKSLFRVKRLIWIKLRSVKKIHRMMWFRLRHGLCYGFSSSFRRRSFIPLNQNNTSLCFW